MALTILVFMIYVCIQVFGIRYRGADESPTFFDIDYTIVMRGCCIIIVFVHIPSAYGDLVQDMVGSFGYICVTLFFLFSGYGLYWNIENKQGYKDSFLYNRVFALLIPYLSSCAFKAITGSGINSGGTAYIYILLCIYVFVYIICRLYEKNEWIYIVCVVVVIYSLVGGISDIGIGWYVESLGFAYGTILAKHTRRIKKHLDERYLMTLLILTILSILCGSVYLRFKYIYFLGSYVLRGGVLGVVLIMWIICVTYRFRPGNKMALFLGKISYEIFLFHGLVIDILIRIDNYYELNLSSGLFITLTIVISVFIASIIKYINDYAVQWVRQQIMR